MRCFTCQKCHGLFDVPTDFDWDKDVCEECNEADKTTNKIRTDSSEPKTQDLTSQENGLSDDHNFTSEASELCFEGDDCVKVNFPIIGDEDELTDGQGEYEEESFSELENPIKNTKAYSMVSSAEGSHPPRSGVAPHATNPSYVVPTYPSEDDKRKVSYRSTVRPGIPTNRKVPPPIPTAGRNTDGSVKKDSAIYGSTGQPHREYRESNDRRQGQESSIGQPTVTTHIRTYDNHTFEQQASVQSKAPSNTQPPAQTRRAARAGGEAGDPKRESFPQTKSLQSPQQPTQLQRPQQQAQIETWSCMECTMLNDNGRLTCSMCGCERCAEPRDAREDSRIKAEQERAWREVAATVSTTASTMQNIKKRDSGTNGDYPTATSSLSTAGRSGMVYAARTPGGSPYRVLGCEMSQYTAGASSACTTMALLAVHKCLNTAQGRGVPYGLTLGTLEVILHEGRSYRDNSHQDVMDVLNSRPDLTRSPTGLHVVKAMVDVSPADPRYGLSLGLKFSDAVRGNVACVVTCQAQSVCIVYLRQESGRASFVLFDSHARVHANQEYGACFLFFDGMEELCDYIRHLFRPVEQPDAQHMSEFEAMQYEQMSIGQADFFCLNVSWEQRDRSALPGSPSSLPPSPITAEHTSLRSQESLEESRLEEAPKTIWTNPDKRGRRALVPTSSSSAVSAPRDTSHTSTGHTTTHASSDFRVPPSPPQSVDLSRADDLSQYQLLREMKQLQQEIFTAKNLLVEEKNAHNITKNELMAMRMALDSAVSDAANMQSVEERNRDRIAQLEGEVAQLQAAKQSQAKPQQKPQPKSQKFWKPKINQAKKAVGGFTNRKSFSEATPPPPSAQSGSPDTSRNVSSSNKQTAATKAPPSSLPAASTAASAHAWGVRDEYVMSTNTPPSNSGASATMGGFDGDLELARRMQLREEAIERDALYAQRVASLSVAPAAAVSVAAPLHVIPLPSCVDSDLELARRIQKQEEESERDARYAQRVADELAAAEAAEMELFRQQEVQAAEDRRIAQEMDKELYFHCVACMDDRVFMEDAFDLGHDDHKMCRECGHGYISNAVNDRHVPVKCPFLNCDHELAEAKCLEVLDEEQQGLWFSLSKRPHADPGYRQCPVPDCSGYDLMDTPEECDARCVVCHHHWCSACQVDMETSQHQGNSCERYQQWKRENDTGDDAMEAFLRQGLQDEDGTDRMRRCPNCRMAYMKDRACMHVTCMTQGGGCGAHFCFRCADFSADSAQAIYQHQGTCRGYQGAGQGA